LVTSGKGNNEAALDLALIHLRLGEAWSKRAEQSTQKADWQQERQWLQRSLNDWQAIKQRGALPPEHEEKLALLVRELANCEAALRK
jgi:hypothetical protein